MSATTEDTIDTIDTIAKLKKEIESLKGGDFATLLEKIKVAGDAYNPTKIKSGKAVAEYEQALAKKDFELIDATSNQYREALEDEKKTIISILETPILTFFEPQKLQQELQSKETAAQSLSTAASIALLKKLSATGQAMQEIQERRSTLSPNETPNNNPTLFSHPLALSKESTSHNKELDKAAKPEHKPPR